MIAAVAAAWILGAVDPSIADELSRVAGHRVSVTADGKSYAIEEIAGEGPPRVGRVERRGADLWLVEDGGGHWRLVGPLAIPRIAGPNYRVWVIGDASGTDLVARRLGILAAPKKRISPAAPDSVGPPEVLPARFYADATIRTSGAAFAQVRRRAARNAPAAPSSASPPASIACGRGAMP